MIVFNVPRRFYSISQVPQAAMTYKLIFYIDWLSSLLLPESLQVKEAQFVKLIGFIQNPISSSMNTHRRGSCTIFFIIDGTNKVERKGIMIRDEEDLEEKKLLGSGGYVYAKLTEKEEINASLGVPHLFLGNVGRLSYDRISRYFCNKCKQEHPGPPTINYENPGEELPGEGLILVEKGQYLCRVCNGIIAIYCKFK